MSAPIVIGRVYTHLLPHLPRKRNGTTLSYISLSHPLISKASTLEGNWGGSWEGTPNYLHNLTTECLLEKNFK